MSERGSQARPRTDFNQRPERAADERLREERVS